MYAWRNALDAGDSAPMKALFGLTLRTELKCAESEETLTETTDAFSLKCNIKVDINHLNDGLKLALVEDREKNSEALGRSALWSGTAKVATLPQYLTVQLMRFFYKVDTQNKAKILRKVRPSRRRCMCMQRKSEGALFRCVRRPDHPTSRHVLTLSSHPPDCALSQTVSYQSSCSCLHL